MSNTFGNILRLTTFGESHGAAMGGIIDGFPVGVPIDLNKVQAEVDSRKTGQNGFSSQRSEKDRVEVLSGLFEGRTTGAPIAFMIKNDDAHSNDYESLKDVYRPSHADFCYHEKYNGSADYRGGGRASARETVSWVVAGAFAQQYLELKSIEVEACVSQIGPVKAELTDDWSGSCNSEVRCPDMEASREMLAALEQAKNDGDSLGGIVSGRIKGLPVGLGEPVFDKFQAMLAEAMFSINAVKGFEIGDGFEIASHRGSEVNDSFEMKDGRVVPSTNHSGGVMGGITNGADVTFRVAFKPTPSIMKEQTTLNHDGEQVTISCKGRHDVCFVPRAVPVVKAMAVLVTLDAMLMKQ